MKAKKDKKVIRLSERRMKTALKRYNDIMYDICCEHSSIGTNLAESTESWNLRDMVAECDYMLSCYYESGNVRCDDRFLGPEAYKEWRHETGILRRFIETYKPYIEDMVCVSGHCSKYDN